MDDQSLLRFSRHILLDELGIDGQQQLLDARVLVIGAGGLGCPAAAYLGSAGIGQLTLVDPDTVDLTNLQRQILHTTDRVGLPKVDSAAQQLRAVYPQIQLSLHPTKADAAWLAQHVPEHDLVLDCTDNFTTRHAINAACVAARVPLVSGAAIRFDGQLTVFDLRRDDSPCYACLFPPDQAPTEVRCATMGVLAPLTGVVGSLQAVEAIKLLSGAGKTLVGQLLLIDVLRGHFDSVRIRKNPHCPVCGS